MSSTATNKVKKSSKNKQEDPTATANDDVHNSFDSRESNEDKDQKEADQAKTTKKKTKKTSQPKEKDITNVEERKVSQEDIEPVKSEDQKVVGDGTTDEKALKKKQKVKKGEEKNKDTVSQSESAPGQQNTEANNNDEDKLKEKPQGDSTQKDITENTKEQEPGQSKPKKKKKEAKKTEGDETTAAEKPKETEKPKAEKKVAQENVQQKDNDQSKQKKTAQKKDSPAIEKHEPVVHADLTGNKPKNVKELEVKSPNVKTKEVAAPVKSEPQKVINLTELKKPEKNIKSEAENKKLKPGQSVLSPKNPPVIDLSAAKYAAPQAATSPKQIIEKGKSISQRQGTSPAIPTEGPLTTKGVEDKPNLNTAKDTNAPPKDIKSPKNAKTPSNKAPVEDPSKKKPTGPLEKQKTIQQSDKSPAMKNKADKGQGRSVTEGPEKTKPTSATFRAAKSPQTYRQSESIVKNTDYFSPAMEDKGKATKNKLEKPRMRSFDAGKTDKITAEDPFEVRSKMWQIRKKEKLLEEEKKKFRKDAQECTFSPRLNQKSISKQLSPYNIYERGLEWNEKIQSAVSEQREKVHEEVTKPVMKPRVKSGSFVALEPRKSQYEGVAGLHFGKPSHMNVPAFSHEPLEYKTNLDNQITEIRDIFDAISSNIKAKSKNTARGSEQQENSARPRTDEPKKIEKVSSPQIYKGTGTKKPVLEKPKEELNRIDSLKGVLNLKPEEKKTQGKDTRKSSNVDSDYFVGETFKPEVLKNPKQIEIRNNRYVMIDNNLSSIEKKDVADSNDVSLNFEGSETK